jgi:hypothetical protein
MNTHKLVTTNGETVSLPCVLPAQMGPHAGAHFRLEALVERDGKHHVRATRLVHQRRHVVHVLPEVFGLMVEEVVTAVRHWVNLLHRMWMKLDDGIVMGFLALIPLAFFEAFHGAELTRQMLEMIFGGGE